MLQGERGHGERLDGCGRPARSAGATLAVVAKRVVAGVLVVGLLVVVIFVFVVRGVGDFVVRLVVFKIVIGFRRRLVAAEHRGGVAGVALLQAVGLAQILGLVLRRRLEVDFLGQQVLAEGLLQQLALAALDELAIVVVVGVICLAIFITGIVLFATTRL
jgi:hypothetical protein